MMTYRLIVILILVLAACSVDSPPPEPTPQPEHTINLNGVERTYYIHVPASVSTNSRSPLFVVFHGLGGHGSRMAQRTGFNDIADREGFIVVYPNGQDGSWIDAGPDSLRLREEAGILDLAFIDELLTTVDSEYGIDPSRVYATGVSNGALFSYLLACQRADRFAAVGLVAGAGITGATEACDPESPISYIAFHGTDDSIVPYEGAEIASGFPELGHYLGAEQALQFWATSNSCEEPPEIVEIEDSPIIDNSTAHLTRYGNCEDSTAVELYTLDHGGHTWPGHPPSSDALGATNRDIDASELIWEFFESHPKQ